jgi:hypothetical protein
MKEQGLVRLFQLLRKHFGEEFGANRFEIRRDDRKRFDAVGPAQVRVHADWVGQPCKSGVREPWIAVRMPGAACGAVGTEALLALLEELDRLGKLKVSRLDLALDDYDRTFTPRQFAEACVDGTLDSEQAKLGPGAVTRVRGKNWEWSRRDGGCFWLGGRMSSRLLRVYDKGRESKGTIPSVRIELQCRNEHALGLLRDLLAARAGERSLEAVWAAHVVGFIDLRVPSGHRSGSATWLRVPWWEDLVRDAVPKTLAKPDDGSAAAWLRACQRQCAGFLRTILELVGIREADLLQIVRNPEQKPEWVAEPEQLLELLAKLARALLLCLGHGPWKLSKDHQLRLRQLREDGAAVRAFAERVVPVK